MGFLNKLKDAMLGDYYDSPELADSVDWIVQEGPSLASASKDEVRDRFKRWVALEARRCCSYSLLFWDYTGGKERGR